MDPGEMIEFGANVILFAKLGNKANEECMNGLLG